MSRAVCIGEAMVELRPAGPGLFARATAGDAFNTAVYLRRNLGPDDRVAFLSATGDDAMSDAILADIESQGVETALCPRAPGALPGLYLIELDGAGERSFHYWRSASAARRWFVELSARGGAGALAGAELVYLSGVSLAILSPQDRAGALDLLAGLRGRVGAIAFDPNVRERLWADLAMARDAIERAVSLADIVLPSEADGALIWGETDPQRQIDRYRALGAREVALTLGPGGVRLFAPGVEVALPAPATAVVDTTGAGDSFNGAYLAARLQGLAPQAAAQRGLDLAARVVASPGALLPIDPSPTEARP